MTHNIPRNTRIHILHSPLVRIPSHSLFPRVRAEEQVDGVANATGRGGDGADGVEVGLGFLLKSVGVLLQSEGAHRQSGACSANSLTYLPAPP
jgi:hypothetical protein